MMHISGKFILALITMTCMAVAGCSRDAAPDASMWAMNIGGGAYSAVDGVNYEADTGDASGTVATLEE
ncbi:MAG: malectin, partial [Gammaproteobacteria bacterium]|nr:malectin [Gammaproteobacteria bacterium]